VIAGVRQSMKIKDHSGPRPARQRNPRTTVADLRLPLVERVGVPWRQASSPVDRPLERDVIAAAAQSVEGRAGAFLLGGAEPLRRRDVLDLLTDLVRIRPDGLGICTAGEGVTVEVAKQLRGAGVRRVHVPFHCARQDAHDWVVRKPGALKMARRAIRAFADAEIPVTAEVVVTRPTMPHLAETVEVLARIGVRSVCIRRLLERDVDRVEFVPLSPRLSLLQTSLEQAASAALERRMSLTLRDFPICVAPRLRPLFAAVDSEVWVAASGVVVAAPSDGARCAECPGEADCIGAPGDYVERFGWEEYIDPREVAVRVQEDVEEQQALRPTAPMVFAWRGPRRVRCEACGDAAEDSADGQELAASTRVIRARLVEAARYRPAVLRLVGADLLAHQHGAQLIYDALRLFARVEVAGEASPVVDWSELDLRRLKDLQRFDVALYGWDAATHDAHSGIPGAFAATMRAVERLRGEARVPVGAYAVLHDATAVAGFAAAWADGSLPGEPRFRLSARGGSLDALAEVASELPKGAVRDALEALLPRCGAAGEGSRAATANVAQQAIVRGKSVAHRPCGSDPVGAFEACRDGEDICAASGCPGVAVGWRSTARSKRWTANT